MSRITDVLESYTFLKSDLVAIRKVIEDTLHSGHKGIDVALERFLDAPGKMLRPAMLMLSARMGEPDIPEMHRLAAAIELLHIATLVHDDIIDEAPLRRGVPTLHTTEGIRKAVLLGDYIFTKCFRLTSDFASPDAARFLSSVVGRICESEIDQGRDSGLSRKAYTRKIAGKTALLFVLSLSLGSSESGCPESTVFQLRNAGYAIGMSFQIVDDIHDYTARSSGIGKPVGNDVKDGLITLPLLLALEEGDENLRRLTQRPGGRIRSSRIRRKVLGSGGIEKAGIVADGYNRWALGNLEKLPGLPARDALVALVEALPSR